MHDVLGAARPGWIVPQDHAQVRAALALVDREHLDVLDVRPQVPLPGVSPPLRFTPAPHPGQACAPEEPYHRPAQGLFAQLTRRMDDDLVLRGAHLRGGGGKAVPHLAGINQREALREKGSGRFDAIDRHQLVEMRLQDLTAQLHADRKVGRELQAGTRPLGICFGER